MAASVAMPTSPWPQLCILDMTHDQYAELVGYTDEVDKRGRLIPKANFYGYSRRLLC